jgi:16S rRNA (cytosine1402-N4)-methyltransferase
MRRPSPAPDARDMAAGVPSPAAGKPVLHVPVMVDAVVEALAPRAGALYIDATFGAGGYTRALLEAAGCRVVAIDRDPDAVERGRELTAAFDGRLALIEGNFGDMERLLANAAHDPVAGIVLDLGVSSSQLDTPERGFSFRLDGPLDMRMSKIGRSAADLVAALSEDELVRVIREFGEERHARRIARAVVAARRQNPIRRTRELADIVRSAVPKAEPGFDPATRTFQALRIVVNDELGEIERALSAAERLLNAGGRLVVVSFHSLEDRRVKDFLRERSQAAPGPSRHAPPPPTTAAPSFRLLHRRPIKPSATETARNPRSRSARLRAAERTAALPWLPERNPQRSRAA